MAALDICLWLENTAPALWIRESLYGFPIVVAVHILSLTLSVGLLVWFDLRLTGIAMARCSVSQLYRRLTPWMFSGFAFMVISGLLLFAAYATRAYENVYFRIKIATLLLAAINAAFFHFGIERHVARWDLAERPPFPARLAGIVSMIAWTIVIMAGRMMSYTMF